MINSNSLGTRNYPLNSETNNNSFNTSTTIQAPTRRIQKITENKQSSTVLNIFGNRVDPSEWPEQIIKSAATTLGMIKPSQNEPLLIELDKKINSTKAKLPEPKHQNTSSAPTPAISPLSTAIDQSKEINTHHSLKMLREKLKVFSMLEILFICSGINDPNAGNILKRLTNLATNEEGKCIANPWEVFVAEYRSQLSYPGYIAAGSVYLFLWRFTSILQTAIDCYSENVLRELRTGLKEDGVKRQRFIGGILEDLNEFFAVHISSARSCAIDKRLSPEASLKQALEEFDKRTSASSNKSLEKIHQEFCQKLSTSLVNQFAPYTTFGYGKTIDALLNSILKSSIRKRLLPTLLYNALIKEEKNPDNYNVLFLTGFTKMIHGQVEKLQTLFESGAIQSSTGTSLQESQINLLHKIVTNLLQANDLVDCTTPEEIEKKLKEPLFEKRGQVQEGIQKGIEEGCQFLFEYLCREENSEEIFGLLFDLFSGPLLAPEKRLTQDDIDQTNATYKNAQRDLRVSVANLSRSFIKYGVEKDILHIGKGSESNNQFAEQLSLKHKQRLETLIEKVTKELEKIEEKLQIIERKEDIYPKIRSILQSIQDWENIERLETDTERHPRPKLASLPKAQQESILKPLQPIYQKIIHTVDLCETVRNHEEKWLEAKKELDLLLNLSKELHNLCNSCKDDPARINLTPLKDELRKLKDSPVKDELIRVTENELNHLLTQIKEDEEWKVTFAKLQAIFVILSEQCTKKHSQKPVLEAEITALLNKLPTDIANDIIRLKDEMIRNRLTGSFSQDDIDSFTNQYSAPLFAYLEEKIEFFNKEKTNSSHQLKELLIEKIDQTLTQIAKPISKKAKDCRSSLNTQFDELKRYVINLSSQIKKLKREKQTEMTPLMLSGGAATLGIMASTALRNYPVAASVAGSLATAGALTTQFNARNALSEDKYLINRAILPIASASAAYLALQQGDSTLLTAGVTTAGLAAIGKIGLEKAREGIVDVTGEIIDDIFSKSYRVLTNPLVINRLIRIPTQQFLKI